MDVVYSNGHVCFAKSKDGYKWEKPNLGLLEHNGNKQNNLIDLGGGEFSVVACVMLHDLDDPDLKRRFKMVFETHCRNPARRKWTGNR